MNKLEDWIEIVKQVTSNEKKINWMAELGSNLHGRKIPTEAISFNLQICEILQTEGMDVEILSDNDYKIYNDRVVVKALKIDVPPSLLEKEKDKHIANVVGSFINKDLKIASKIYIYDLCSDIFREPFNNTLTLSVKYGIVPVSNDESDPEIEAINDYLILRKEYQLDAGEIRLLSKTQRMYLINKYKKNNVKQING